MDTAAMFGLLLGAMLVLFGLFSEPHQDDGAKRR
jgi:hypothetical protein